jgi:hypothetical protein
MMPDDLARAIDRFLGSAPGVFRPVAPRQLAHAAIEAWREGRVPTTQALRTLHESYEAMHGLAGRKTAAA